MARSDPGDRCTAAPGAALRRLPVAALLLITAVGVDRAGAAGPPLREALGITPLRIRPIKLLPPRRDGEEDPDEAPVDIGISPSDQEVDEVLAGIVRAEALLAKQQWVKAAAAFQELIDRNGDAVIPAVGDTYIPARSYCTARLLAPGPTQKLATYRASYGAVARRAVDEARSARTPALLLAVVRRFGATRAALEALDVLAAMQLERGQALWAMRTCRRRLALDPGTPAPHALAKLALALARADRREDLDRLAAAADKHYPAATVTIGGRAMRLTIYVRRLRDKLPDRAADAGCGRIADRAVRPGTLLWQTRLERPRKRAPWVAPPVLVESIVPALETALYDAVAHRDVVYCQSLAGIRAIDAFSGRVLWQADAPAGQIADHSAALAFLPVPGQRWDVPRGTGLVAPVVAGDRLLAAFSLALPQGGGVRVRWPVFGRLDALPLTASAGASLWSVNAREESRIGPEDEQIPALRFAGRPAVTGDTVCVGAKFSQSDSDAFLMGYRVSDGRRLWRTKVAATNWAGAQAIRISDGPPPLPSDGLVFYCGNLGTVAAADPVDGSLVWVTRYPHRHSMLCTLQTIGGQKAVVTAPPNPPLASGGLVFVFPRDSDCLYAFDAATGAVRWRRKLRGRQGHTGDADHLYLLAVRGGRVYLSGSTVLCLDAATGRTRWRSVRLASFAAGRGVVGGDYVMCPIEGSIAMIDVGAAGRLAQPIGWSHWARAADRRLTAPVGSGNLRIADGQLVVTRNDAISVFAAEDAEQILRRRVAREPDRPRHLLKLAALRAGTARWADAAGAYRKAVRLLEAQGAPSRLARGLLADTYRQLAGELEKKQRWGEVARALGQAVALEHRPVAADRAAVRIDTRMRLARALEKSKDLGGALAALHDVIHTFGDTKVQVPAERGPSGLRFTPQRIVRADVLAAVRIAELLRQHGPGAYTAYDQQASAVHRKAPGTAATFRALARRYPNSTILASLRLGRATAAIRERRFAAATGELLAIERLSPGFAAPRARALRELLRNPGDRRPKTGPTKPGELLSTAWHVRTDLGQRVVKESLAEVGGSAGGPLFYADGKALKAFDPVSGKLAWQTRVGWLGVSFLAPGVAPPGMRAPAVEFTEVMAGHPADKAGAKAGDLLLSFDGHRLGRKLDLIQACGTTPPGKTVEMVVLRPPWVDDARWGPVRRWRRLTLRAVLGERPRRLDQRLLRPAAEEFIRVVGLEGDSVLATVDLALLWVRAGRVVSRAIIAPLSQRPARTFRRGHQILLSRGRRPVMGDGVVVAATPSGELVCFELGPAEMTRRWSVRFQRTGIGPAPSILRLALWNGRVAALVDAIDTRTGRVKPEVHVFDAFSGRSILSDAPGADGTLEECKLLPAGPGRLVVAVPGQLLGYDTTTGKRRWSVAAKELAGTFFPEVAACSGKVVAMVNRRVAVGLDPATGRILWKCEPGGYVRRLVCAGDRGFLAAEFEGRYSVTCCSLKDGKPLWSTRLAQGVGLPSMNAVPFAAAHGGRLFIAQNLTTRTHRPLAPTLAAVRISDGKILRYVGLGHIGGYNRVFGGKISRSVITLITESGLMGIRTDSK